MVTPSQMKEIAEKGIIVKNGSIPVDMSERLGMEKVKYVIDVADTRQTLMDAYYRRARYECMDDVRYDKPSSGIKCICEKLDHIGRDIESRQKIAKDNGIQMDIAIEDYNPF